MDLAIGSHPIHHYERPLLHCTQSFDPLVYIKIFMSAALKKISFFAEIIHLRHYEEEKVEEVLLTDLPLLPPNTHLI